MSLDSERDTILEAPLLVTDNSQNQKSSEPLRKTLIGLGLLAISIFSYGSMFPVIATLRADGMFLKLTWRYICSAIMFLPLALLAKNENGQRWTLKTIFTQGCVTDTMVTALCWVTWIISILTASYTYSFMIADLFGNMASVFILFDRYLRKVKILPAEILGVAIAVCGGCVVFLGPQQGQKSHTELAIAVALGLFGAWVSYVYFAYTEKIVAQIPMDVYIFLNSFFGLIGISVVTFVFEDVEFSFDPEKGYFGIFATENLVMVPFLTIVCGLFVMKAANTAIVYCGSLIVSVAFLMAPPIVGFESYLVGVDKMPNWSSWFSVGIMTVGLFFIIIAPKIAKEPKVQEIDCL